LAREELLFIADAKKEGRVTVEEMEAKTQGKLVDAETGEEVKNEEG
jgi:hypothetical protein